MPGLKYRLSVPGHAAHTDRDKRSAVAIHRHFTAVPGHLPNQALGPKFAVEPGIQAIATVIDIEALTALTAESGLVFLTDRQGFATGMILAVHSMNSLGEIIPCRGLLRQSR